MEYDTALHARTCSALDNAASDALLPLSEDPYNKDLQLLHQGLEVFAINAHKYFESLKAGHHEDHEEQEHEVVVQQEHRHHHNHVDQHADHHSHVDQAIVMSASIDPDVADKAENDEFCQSAGYPKKVHFEEHEPVHHEELAHGLFEDPDGLQEGDLLAL